MTYNDYNPASKPMAVVEGKLVPLDGEVVHVLAVNAMALAVGMPSSGPAKAAAEVPAT